MLIFKLFNEGKCLVFFFLHALHFLKLIILQLRKVLWQAK